MPPRIAVILKGYPRLSETFIAQELKGLEQAGLDLALYSMRHPTDEARHPVHEEIAAPVVYLPEYLKDDPVRVLRAWWRARRLAGYRQARKLWLGEFWRDPTPNRGRRWGQALVLAAELPGDIAHLHAHFIHTPATVTHYAAIMRGIGWSCSAHAKDIWTSSDADLGARIAAAQWVVTCTQSGFDRLRRLARDGSNLHLSYHGLDLARFASPVTQRPAAAKSGDPVRLLTVCRAVEKKGLDVLLDALARLDPSLDWRWSHIGGGDRVAVLKQQAERLGIADRLTWHGAMVQDDVLSSYRRADLFVLACRVARDGDRDGLPNVILEAQSQALPVVSSHISGVPELITDGENGLLVPPEDPARLAGALETLIRDAALRGRLGRRGEQIVRERFSHRTSIDFLCSLFHRVLKAQMTPA